MCEGVDLCWYTSASQAVDQNGCSNAQVDADNDDVCENDTSPGTSWCSGTDACWYTPSGQAVDTNGCSASQARIAVPAGGSWLTVAALSRIPLERTAAPVRLAM
jgi:hypothetical protein